MRDKVAVGALDGYHLLAPMALAATANGEGAILAPLALNQNGGAVTVSTALAEEIGAVALTDFSRPPVTAEALARVVAERRARGQGAADLRRGFPVLDAQLPAAALLAGRGRRRS
ncbi:ABC transporter substrate-binding protein [Caulobacter segnis]